MTKGERGNLEIRARMQAMAAQTRKEQVEMARGKTGVLVQRGTPDEINVGRYERIVDNLVAAADVLGGEDKLNERQRKSLADAREVLKTLTG